MLKIQTISEQAFRKPTTAPKAIQAIIELSTKWNKDFQNCDPRWHPPTKTQSAANPQKQALALSAYIQH